MATRDAWGGGRPRGRSLLVALAAVLVIVGVLAVVDRQSGSDDRRAAVGGDTTTTTNRATATSRRTTTPTPSTTRTFEPTIPLPAGARLLGWPTPIDGEVLDPATGTVVPIDLPEGVFDAALPRLGGVVVLAREGVGHPLWWYPDLPSAGEPVPLAIDAIRASPGFLGGMALYPSEIASRVWIVLWGEPASFAEIDVATGEVLGLSALPSGAFPVGSIDGGLVIEAADGLYVLRRGADNYEWIVSGRHVASSGHWLAYRSCDEFLSCPISVRDLDAGTDVEMDMAIGQTPDASSFGYAVLAPDGRWLAVAGQDPSGWRLDVYEVATGRSLPVSSGVELEPPTLTGFPPGPTRVAWTPVGAWLLWPEAPGIRAFRPDDTTTVVLDAGGAEYLGVAVLPPPTPAAD